MQRGSSAGRVLEIGLGLVAFGLVGLTSYLVAGSVSSGEVTMTTVANNLGVTYVLLCLVVAVTVFGCRLMIVRARPQGRLVSPAGIAAFSLVMLGLAAASWKATGQFPVAALPVLGGLVVGLFVWRVRNCPRP